MTTEGMSPKPCPACRSTVLDVRNVIQNYYSVVCPCGMRGPMEFHDFEAVDAWDKLPRAPIWSETPPDSPGWYYLREQGRTIPWSYSGIVHIYYDKETEALQITGRGRVERGVSSYGVKGYLTQWSQRIPLPIDETGLPSE